MGCTSLDTSRRQAEHLAVEDAKRNALEEAGTHIRTATMVKDLAVQSDLIHSFARASVRLIKRLREQWEKSGRMDSCLHLTVQAEVIPEPEAMQRIARKAADDPNAPLNVRLWVDHKDGNYHRGEQMRIYLKGNKPFFARLVYRDAAGHLLQLLPNPYRRDDYFRGGVVYAVPGGKDRFALEVSPPFGEEQITLYASTAPGGRLDLRDAGPVYEVATAPKDVAIRTRGITIKQVAASASGGAGGGGGAPAEFAERSVTVHTAR